MADLLTGPTLRFSQLDPGAIRKNLFEKLRIERLEGSSLSRMTQAGKILEFFLQHTAYHYHTNPKQDEIIALTHLVARLQNTQGGSPTFSVWMGDRLMGLAFLLQYDSDRRILSWEALTRNGSFLDDNAKSGSRLACAELLSGGLEDGSRGQGLDGRGADTVRVRLMDEVLGYASVKYPKPVGELTVWTPSDDADQCGFHARYAMRMTTAPQRGMSVESLGGLELQVYDYTPLLRELSVRERA